MTILRRAAFWAVPILAAGTLCADTITNWTGGISTNYGTAGNWSNGVANGAFSATIPGGTTFAPTTAGTYTVDNLTLSAAGSALTIGDNSGLIVNASNGGSITNNGSVSMNSAGSFTSLQLEGTSTVTLSGTGTLTMNNTGHDRIYADNAGLTLVNNSTIQGAGQLVTNGNVGTAYAFTNNGTVSATGGLTVSTLGGTTNTGTLQAASGGTLLLLNDTFTQTGNGTILAQDGGTVNLQTASISGGTLTTQGTGSITTFNNTTSTLSGNVTISNGSNLTVADTGNINLAPGLVLTNNGTLALSSAGNFTQLEMNAAGTVTLDGTGTYMLGDNSHNRIIANATGATLINNSTIQGSGELINTGSVGQPYALVNNGTITSSGTTGLTIENGGGVSNTGTVQSSSGSNLTIANSTVTQTGNGTLVAANSTLVNLQGATINGGTLTSGASAAFTTVGNSSVTLGNGTTLSTGSNLIVANSGSLDLQAGTTVTNNGQISLNSSGSVTQVILEAGAMGAGTVTLSGSGLLTATCTVPMTNCASVAPDNKITANVTGMTLVNDVNHTISGSVNMVAGSSGDPFTFINNGILSEAAGNVLAMSSGVTFSNFANNTLTGGSYTDAGTIQFNNADIVHNAAAITMEGTGEFTDQSSNNALANFADNTSSGSFSLHDGSSIIVSGAFTNSGMLTVGSTDMFTTGAGATYNQGAGITQVDGTLTASGGVTVSGGELKGSGTIIGSVTVLYDGSSDPGDSPGTLSIIGNYSMGSGSNFGVLFAGDTAGEYDVLDVTGTATLGGTLNLTTMAGFTPVAGQQFDIMNFASSIGMFSSITGADLGNGYSFAVSYNPTDVVVTVDGPVQGATPEPGTLFLLGLGLAGLACLRRPRRRVDR